MGNQDVDKTLELAKTFKKGVTLGEKIAKDGLGVDDLQHAPEAVAFAVELYNSAKHYAEIKEEITDIDAAEGILILQTLLAK